MIATECPCASRGSVNALGVRSAWRSARTLLRTVIETPSAFARGPGLAAVSARHEVARLRVDQHDEDALAADRVVHDLHESGEEVLEPLEAVRGLTQLEERLDLVLQRRDLGRRRHRIAPRLLLEDLALDVLHGDRDRVREEVLRGRRVRARPGRALGLLGIAVGDERHDRVADLDLVAVAEDLVGDLLPVHEGPVGALEVLQAEGRALERDLGVGVRDGEVPEADVLLGRSAYEERLVTQGNLDGALIFTAD
jgi:hypothetical protein